MIESTIQKYQDSFRKVIEHFQADLGSVRTGRASPSLLSTVQVESYGSLIPLEHLASVGVSDARTLTVTPWDKGQLPAIEKAIQAANLGFNPSNDGTVIRIALPVLTEDRRKEMVKLLGQIAEKAKIGIRNVREDVIKEMKRTEGEGGVSKDDLARGQKKLQEVVDKLNDEIERLAEAKEKEIMTI